MRQLYECDDCGSMFYLTHIDGEKERPQYCPYCAEEEPKAVQDE